MNMVWCKMEKQKHTLVSVIVLCYQNYSLLERCVKSILMQDYPQIELIISDDASDYFPREKLIAFIEENKQDNLVDYSVIVNPENLGTVKNITNAFKQINGKYYITSGADDVLADSQAITNFMTGFQQFPDAVWICGNTIQVNVENEKAVDRFPTDYDIPFFQKRNAKELWNIWARRGILCSAAICYDIEVMNIVGGFDQNYRYIEDWPIFLKLLRKGYAPGYIDKLVCKRSVGGISFSKNVSGNEVRRRFLDEKHYLFRTEVEPYIDMMSKNDRKKYKYYLSEVLERTYFFEFEFANQKSKKSKLKLMFSSSKHFLWIFEKFYWKFYEKIGHKALQWNVCYLVLLLLLIYVECATGYNSSALLNFIGNLSICFTLSISVIVLAIGSVKKVLKYREKKRNMVCHS